MFWEKSYSQSQNIENLLQREDLTVEELLDDQDILQECKLQSRHLMQFFTRPGVIKKLITLIITEPPENLSVSERFRHSNIACEILTCGLPSLDEKLVEDTEILQTLYSFLENEPPLNPLLAAFFSKTFSMLITKKPEQDWFLYQKTCLQLLEFIKSRGNFLDLMLKHFAAPVIADLLLQIIREVQGGTLKKNLYEWLTELNVVERVIRILGNVDEQEKHTNAAEFIIELIKHGRSMRQSLPEDSLEQAFIGSDPLLQALEDEKTMNHLLDAMFEGKPQESSIVSGILIVLTLVDESIVDEPASDKALKKMIDKEKENHERVVADVIKIIAPRLNEFHTLLIEPPTKLQYPLGMSKSFGRTRLEICRLFTVLLQTGNNIIINAICETGYFNTLLKLFKEYSWNNFLHSEVEKCLGFVFNSCDQNAVGEENTESNLSALQKHVLLNCKIISKLLECWSQNTEVQLGQNGRRLGYMGHLIQIIKNVSQCLFKTDRDGALIESFLNDAELASWKVLTERENGELWTELSKQERFLADCDPSVEMRDNVMADNDINVEVNLGDGLDDTRTSLNYFSVPDNAIINCILSSIDEFCLDLQNDDVGIDRFGMNETKSDANSLNVTVNPWGGETYSKSTSNSNEVGGWADFSSNNFADFDSHFSLYSNDFGDRYDPNQTNNESSETQSNMQLFIEKSDGNANVEKTSIVAETEPTTDVLPPEVLAKDLETAKENYNCDNNAGIEDKANVRMSENSEEIIKSAEVGITIEKDGISNGAVSDTPETTNVRLNGEMLSEDSLDKDREIEQVKTCDKSIIQEKAESSPPCMKSVTKSEHGIEADEVSHTGINNEIVSTIVSENGPN